MSGKPTQADLDRWTAIDKTEYFSRPGGWKMEKNHAIKMAREILEHYEMLPTADEVDSLEQYAIRCGWANATHMEQSETEATIAKLRRLIGEETP